MVSRAHIDLFAFRPYFGFVAWSAHFSHPAGLFRQRVDFLTRLAGTHSSLLFHQALTQNRYDPIDGLLLEPDDHGWLFRFSDDNFPDRTVDRGLHFARDLLAEPCFRSTTEGELTLIQANASCNPPLAGSAGAAGDNATGATAAAVDLEAMATRYNLGVTFGAHVQGVPSAVELAQLGSQLLAADLATLSEVTLLDLLWASEGELAQRVETAFAARIDHPLNIVLREPQGGGELLVLGYNLEPGGAAGQPPVLALYFEVLQPLRQDYDIWLHSEQNEAQVKFDHQSPAVTSTWLARSVYLDRTVLEGMPEQAEVAFGFWNGATDARLARDNGDTWLDLGSVMAGE